VCAMFLCTVLHSVMRRQLSLRWLIARRFAMFTKDYIECVRAFGKHSKCREETKAYIMCRMNKCVLPRAHHGGCT